MRSVLVICLVLQVHVASADEREACLSASSAAQDLRRDKKLIESRVQLLTCARDVCPAVVRNDCTQWIAEVDASMATVVITLKEASGVDVIDARALLDGAPYLQRIDGLAQPINPGVHALRVEATSGAVIEQTIVVREGEKNRLVSLTLPAPATTVPEPVSPPATQPSALPEVAKPTPATPSAMPVSDDAVKHHSQLPAFVAGGAGLALLGAALVVSLSGDATYDDAKAETSNQDRRDELYDSANTKRYVAQGLAVAGVGCVGVAIWLYVRGREPSSSSTARTNVLVSPQGIAIGGAF